MEHHLWTQTNGKVITMCLSRRYVLILMFYIVGVTVGCDHTGSIDEGRGLVASPEVTDKFDFGSPVPPPLTNSYLLCRVDSDLLESNTLWSVDVWRRDDDAMTAIPRCGTISDIRAAFSATEVRGSVAQGVAEHSEMFSICGNILSVTWIGNFTGNYYDVRICTFLPMIPKKMYALGYNVFASDVEEYELCYDRMFNHVTDVVVTQKSGECLIVIYGDMNPCSEDSEEVRLFELRGSGSS